MAVSFVVTVIRRLFSRIQNSVQTLCRLSIFHNYNSVFATIPACLLIFYPGIEFSSVNLGYKGVTQLRLNLVIGTNLSI